MLPHHPHHRHPRPACQVHSLHHTREAGHGPSYAQHRARQAKVVLGERGGRAVRVGGAGALTRPTCWVRQDRSSINSPACPRTPAPASAGAAPWPPARRRRRRSRRPRRARCCRCSGTGAVVGCQATPPTGRGVPQHERVVRASCIKSGDGERLRAAKRRACADSTAAPAAAAAAASGALMARAAAGGGRAARRSQRTTPPRFM